MAFPNACSVRGASAVGRSFPAERTPVTPRRISTRCILVGLQRSLFSSDDFLPSTWRRSLPFCQPFSLGFCDRDGTRGKRHQGVSVSKTQSGFQTTQSLPSNVLRRFESLISGGFRFSCGKPNFLGSQSDVIRMDVACLGPNPISVSGPPLSRTRSFSIRASNEQTSSEKEAYIVTTPLFYANAAPHLGSAYTTIASDAISRFQRLQGRKVIFITGMDEHGEKIALSAQSQGKDPQTHCDEIADKFKKLWKKLDISYDRFIRTTDPKHEIIVKEFYDRVWKKGDIYRAQYNGYYCVGCEEYKDEKDLIELKCPIHQTLCSQRVEDNYFFSCSKYQVPISELSKFEKDYSVETSIRRMELKTWIEEGVRDFSISRASVEWGIKIPNDPDQTIYVWFDALLGYISALLEEGEEVSLENALAKGWPPSVQIIGKDILRFHTIYWPSMLLSADLPPPKLIYAHGFLTKDGMKMGKSLGNVVDPDRLTEIYGSDPLRYFLLKTIDFGEDADFTITRFRQMCNANLANTIGNLLKRTLSLLKNYCSSSVVIDTSSIDEDHVLVATAKEKVEKAKEYYNTLTFHLACECILDIATAANVYVDERKPWELFKKGEEEARLAAIDMAIVMEALRIVSVALSPVIPNMTLKMYEQLGYSKSEYSSLTWEDTNWGQLKAGHVFPEPLTVFPRLEESDEFPETMPTPATKKAKGKKKKGNTTSGTETVKTAT